MFIRYHRRTHRVGRLSEDEKAARLAQMTHDAASRHQHATEKIARAEKRDQAELDALKQKMKRMDDDGRGAAHEMASAVAKWVSKGERKLEDSVTSRKYYSQNRRDAKFGR